jgi:density-regulated protein
VAVVITRKDRGRGKSVTSIRGLEAFDLKLKDVASALGKKFGAGATVGKDATGVSTVDVQGDMTEELPDVLTALYGIPEEAILVKD